MQPQLPAGARNAQGRVRGRLRGRRRRRGRRPLTEEQKQEKALRAMMEAATGAFGGAPMEPRSS
eukprot:2336418-Pyramimonas_sp.AAC.1